MTQHDADVCARAMNRQWPVKPYVYVVLEKPTREGDFYVTRIEKP